jgi:hypothetical protein
MTTNNSWSRDDQIEFYLSPEKWCHKILHKKCV